MLLEASDSPSLEAGPVASPRGPLEWKLPARAIKLNVACAALSWLIFTRAV